MFPQQSPNKFYLISASDIISLYRKYDSDLILWYHIFRQSHPEHITVRCHKWYREIQASSTDTVPFPHFTVLSAAVVKYRCKAPMLQILRSIELRLSPTGHGTVRHQRIISVVLFPDLWIPKIFPATSFRKHIGSNHRIVCKLMIGLSEVSPSPMAIACCCRIRESPSASVSSITSVYISTWPFSVSNAEPEK